MFKCVHIFHFVGYWFFYINIIYVLVGAGRWGGATDSNKGVGKVQLEHCVIEYISTFL